MRRVCIVGVGLMGGSLGMALRRVRGGKSRAYHVLGLGRSSSTLRLAKKRGAVDDFSTQPSQAVPTADIVVLCTPVHLIGRMMKKIAPLLKRGAIVTDVGSVKRDVRSVMKRLLSGRKDISFVGAHPLAGSEKAGIRYAEADLFRKAVAILTVDGTRPHASAIIKKMWTDVGARPVQMNAREHDRVLSLTSHLPHVIAFSLFSLVSNASRKNSLIKSLVAGSFRDMTRIAGSDPDVWTGILQLNRAEIRRSAAQFVRVLTNFLNTPDKKVLPALRAINRSKKSW